MFEVFDSEASKRKKGHLKNLVSLAKLDGHVTQEELGFLVKVGARNEISESEIRKMLTSASVVKVFTPHTDAERFEIIYDLIEMILADGIIEDTELEFAIDFCDKLGFRPAISGVLVRKIATDLVEGKSKQHIHEKVKGFIK
ncbi:MAG TPA: hypothetical protein VL947_06585 [Cytophagales bacterium]|nr:hypothetical protein [Cytophagales bacterium]